MCMCMRGLRCAKGWPLQGGAVHAYQLYPHNKYVQKQIQHITCCWPGSGLQWRTSMLGVTVASAVVALVDWPANCCACSSGSDKLQEFR